MKSSLGAALTAAVCALSLFASAPAVAQDIELREVFSGLTEPLDIQFPPDESGRVFVVERGGTVRIFNGASLLPTPFLSVESAIDDSDVEEGLLGMDFHPEYESNGRFFLAATLPGSEVALAEGTVSDNWNQASLASMNVLLSFDHGSSSERHNGGQVQFGPDGYLYWGIGDGGSTSGNAQDTSVLLGKILRLDVSKPGTYSSPPTNPFAGEGSGRDEIWDYGLRNPWRFSWDRDTGDFWISDVGQSAFEEVNLEPFGSDGEVNYGWPTMEASSCYSPSSGCNQSGLTLPVIDYAHTNQPCDSLTGGFRYRGDAIPAIAGEYIYADYCNGQIFGAVDGGSSWSASTLLSSGMEFAMTSFGEDPDGELWVTHYGDGSVYKIVPPVPHVRVTGSCPGSVTVKIDGGSSNGKLFGIISDSSGATVVPSGSCSGTVVPVANGQLATTLVAQADGSFSASFNLGDSTCGRVIAVLDQTSCEVSSAVSLPD